MFTPVRSGLSLPPYLGLGWLDRHSVRSSPTSDSADYADGEDLVYRVRACEGRWVVTEFLDLTPVAEAEGSSLSAAIASLVARAGPGTVPASWVRLARRLRGRADVTRTGVPAMVQLWTLYSVDVVALYRGTGRPPAPDFRPKSYQVQASRPPRPQPFWIHSYSTGSVVELGSGATTSCTIVGYRTPVINVAAVVEGLTISPQLPPPWRTAVVNENWAPGPVIFAAGNAGDKSWVLRQNMAVKPHVRVGHQR